jgi:rod shape-determining protein MreD
MFSNYLDIPQLKITFRAFSLTFFKLLFIFSISFIAIGLQILPLPHAWVGYWPMWVPLSILIWSMVLPSYWMIAYAWLLGLLLDSVYGNKLGTHAIGLSLISYLTYYALLPNQLNTSNRINHVGFIFLFFMLYYILIGLIRYLTGIPVTFLGKQLLWPPFLSTVIWFYLVDVIRFIYLTLSSE